jgi:hypothetical protein
MRVVLIIRQTQTYGQHQHHAAVLREQRDLPERDLRDRDLSERDFFE